MKDFDSLIFDLDGTLWDTCEACAVAWNNVVIGNKGNFKKKILFLFGLRSKVLNKKIIKLVFFFDNIKLVFCFVWKYIS